MSQQLTVVVEDKIAAHFDECWRFMDRPRSPVTRSEIVRERRLTGKSIAPAPVACATFARGETIRMSFWQPANKPWRFHPVKAWLCQVIGNERARTQDYGYVATSLARRIEAAQELERRGATEGERKAGADAVSRLQRREAMAAALNAFSDKYGRVYAPAADITAFWVEHDGKVYRPDSLQPPANVTQIRQHKPQATVAATDPMLIISKMRELIGSYAEMLPDECRAAENFVAVVVKIAA